MSTIETAGASTIRDAGLAALVSPNQYHLAGDGIAVSYLPLGSGPVGPAGGAELFYQQRVFHADEIRSVHLEDIGTVVSVTLEGSVDAGTTTFSLVIPAVLLPRDGHASAPIETFGVTTLHRGFAAQIGFAQRETYTIAHLRGDAVNDPLPL
jgi:hypothetical protein